MKIKFSKCWESLVLKQYINFFRCYTSFRPFKSCKLSSERIFQYYFSFRFYLHSHIATSSHSNPLCYCLSFTSGAGDFMLENVYAFIIIIILFHETFYDIKFFTLNIQFPPTRPSYGKAASFSSLHQSLPYLIPMLLFFVFFHTQGVKNAFVGKEGINKKVESFSHWRHLIILFWAQLNFHYITYPPFLSRLFSHAHALGIEKFFIFPPISLRPRSVNTTYTTPLSHKTSFVAHVLVEWRLSICIHILVSSTAASQVHTRVNEYSEGFGCSSKLLHGTDRDGKSEIHSNIKWQFERIFQWDDEDFRHILTEQLRFVRMRNGFAGIISRIRVWKSLSVSAPRRRLERWKLFSVSYQCREQEEKTKRGKKVKILWFTRMELFRKKNLFPCRHRSYSQLCNIEPHIHFAFVCMSIKS